MRFASASEGLSDRKEKLEVADVLRRGQARAGRRALHKLRVVSGESIVFRRIQTVGDVETQRPKRRSVPNTKAHRVRHVVEVRDIFLLESKRNRPRRREHISKIFEQNAA